MNILLSTIYTEDWQPIVDLTKPSLIEYCAKHNYSYTYTKYEKKLKDFDKIRTLREIVTENYFDAIWAIDADALITNHNYRVEDFMDDAHDLFICKDINGLNCGSFIVRQSNWIEWLLAWMLDLEGVSGMHCEQDAVRFLYDTVPTQAERNIKILPQSTINSYMYELYPEHGTQSEENGQWIDGKSFVLHLPGVGMDLRKKILSETNVTK